MLDLWFTLMYSISMPTLIRKDKKGSDTVRHIQSLTQPKIQKSAAFQTIRNIQPPISPRLNNLDSAATRISKQKETKKYD